jgi:YHS domain-containing protein
MKTTIAIIAASLLAGLAGAAPSKTKPYPKNTCIVSDNKLGSMGSPITKVHEGQEVKFCCKPCVKKFDKNPAKYLAKL